MLFVASVLLTVPAGIDNRETVHDNHFSVFFSEHGHAIHGHGQLTVTPNIS